MQNRSPLPEDGFVREKALVGPDGLIPISRSALWEWVRKGTFPAPVKLGPRVTAWRVQDVRQFLDKKSA